MPFFSNVTSATLAGTTWEWGIGKRILNHPLKYTNAHQFIYSGMWAIIFPICTIPLFFSLWHAERRAKKQGLLDDIPSPYKAFGNKEQMIELFWQIDLVGLFLLAATMALILLPFTL